MKVVQDYTDFFTKEEWDEIEKVEKFHDTPFLVMNLNKVKEKFVEMKKTFYYSNIYYSLKANPSVEIIRLLKDLDSFFDIASIYELDKVLTEGVLPDKISFGSTIKKASDIKYFYDKGIRLFVTDSEADLKSIAKYAPNSRIFVRILTEGSDSSDWALSRKFGCHPDMATDLILLAKKLGLEPYGVSFHVGSQQRDIGSWNSAIVLVKYIFNRLLIEHSIKLKMINMGGGFPAKYANKTNELSLYADEIKRFLDKDFSTFSNSSNGDFDLPEIIIEPGRAIVAEAGVIVSEVILISRKTKMALNRWVYTDIGKFNGLIETTEESIKYPIYTNIKNKNERSRKEREEVILAGPTCDSQDVMYEEDKYELPLDLSIGDKLYWLTAGAYTTSYSSIEFNGLPPLKTICI